MKLIRHSKPIALFAFAAMLATVTVIQAGDVAQVPYPQDFRSWQHVKSIVIEPEHPSFAVRGGIHHYYANELAMKGYRSGTFPNGSVIVDEGVFTKAGEAQGKGITLEGERRTLDVMIKNDRLYADTGGWGFDHFERNDRTGTPDASRRAKCAGCHATAQRDHVFSSVRP
jgi:hypothetical protein